MPADHKRLEKQWFDANKLEQRLCRLTGQAIADFNMIETGDRVTVCFSGGKDSYGLFGVLLEPEHRSQWRQERQPLVPQTGLSLLYAIF